MLIEALGNRELFAVVGGSVGGMQALQWAADFPERLFSVVSIASAPRHSAQNIAFHEVGRQAIMADPDLARRRLRRPGRAAGGRAWPWREWARTST